MFSNWRGCKELVKGNPIGMSLFVDHASLGEINSHESLNLNLAGSRVPIGRVR